MGSEKPAGGTFFKYISPEWRFVYERYQRKEKENRVQHKRVIRDAEAQRVEAHNRGLPGSALIGAQVRTSGAMQSRRGGGSGALK